MHNFKIHKIITPTVLPSPNNAVIPWSEQLSKSFQAQLVLYNAVSTDGTDGELDTTIDGNKINLLIKSAMQRLRIVGKGLTRAYKVRYLVEVGSHWRNLLKQVRDERADLLIAGMPAETGKKISMRLAELMYNSPCPVLFVREGMLPAIPRKILVPVRLKDRLEQKLPVVITWAKNCDATVCLSAFSADGASSKENLRLYNIVEKMAGILRNAGVKVESETVHGFHFGTTMVHRARLTGADLIAIAVEPVNYLSQLFTKMVGPYFLENALVPVLSVPLFQPVREQGDLRLGSVTGDRPMPEAASMATV